VGGVWKRSSVGDSENMMVTTYNGYSRGVKRFYRLVYKIVVLLQVYCLIGNAQTNRIYPIGVYVPVLIAYRVSV
jgi:hypothetical protein